MKGGGSVGDVKRPRDRRAGEPAPARPLPEGTRLSLHRVRTGDGAVTSGVLFRRPGPAGVVTVMHPRIDVSAHPAVPALLESGFDVWAQNPRNVGSDLALIHEEALLDVAAGMIFLRDIGYEHVVCLGHSGGAALYAYYTEQAGLEPGRRFGTTPAGTPTGLGEAEMPVPDAAVFLAAHPGQGELLAGCIDPSVTDEADPLSIDPSLDLFSPENGFAAPPGSSSYSQAFLTRYRKAQRERTQRIDAVALELVARAGRASTRRRAGGGTGDRRAATAARLITVYRTDADPRTVDLTIDPSPRPYGSVWGLRPDLTNYGVPGFGRVVTPQAWLSTWSATHSRASFRRCAAGVRIPCLFIELTGDQATTPAQSRRLYEALASPDTAHERVPGRHFGQPLEKGMPPGIDLAMATTRRWLCERLP